MFITFEGIEGSGKSTALDATCALLARNGKSHLRTLEPGGSELGLHLRALLLDARRELVPEAELFLYLADRAQHVRQIIKPALAAGKIILCDRYADSTIVYQGFGRGGDIEHLFQMNDVATAGLWPDLTLLFDLPPETGLARARARNEAKGASIAEGRFEAENLAFHHRIRNGYLIWAEQHPARFRILDASKPAKMVFEQLLTMLDGVLLPEQ